MDNFDILKYELKLNFYLEKVNIYETNTFCLFKFLNRIYS